MVLRQNMGLEMTMAERNKYDGNKKKKREGIRYGTSFYSTIFELYQDNNTLLPNIRKNNSEAKRCYDLPRALLKVSPSHT